jgi:hypothetical protein
MPRNALDARLRSTTHHVGDGAQRSRHGAADERLVVHDEHAGSWRAHG